MMSKKLKICYVGWGDSIHLQRWASFFVDGGHDVYLITNRASNMPGIKEIEVSDQKQLLPRFLIVRNIIRGIKPDILHLHTLLYPAYLGVFSGFCPMIVTPWNGDIVWKAQWSLIRKIAVLRGLRNADLITVDSEELKQKTLHYGKYENKIHFVSFGVDTKLFRPNGGSGNLRKELNIDENAPIVFSGRSLEKIYNIEIILSAVPLVLREIPDAVFVFCWHSDSMKDELLAAAVAMGIFDNVRFAGKVKEHKDLINYYAQAEAFISVPSCDTIPVSLLEAMACGTAPIISDLPSPKECITDGKNGCVVPVRDVNATAKAIVRVLKNNKIRNAFARFNLEFVKKKYDWVANMKKMENLYHRCRK